MKKTIFTKYSDARRDEFKIRTSITEENGIRKVVKSPIGKSAENHILTLKKAEQYFNGNKSGIVYSECSIEGNCAVFNYIKGKSYNSHMKEVLENGGYKAFLNELESYRKFLTDNIPLCSFKCSDGFKQIFGELHSLDGMEAFEVSNIDIIFPNIILTGSQWNIIDYEWTFFFPVPVDFIIFRAIRCFITENYKYGLNESDILRFMGTDQAMAKVFSEMEDSFQRYVEGGSVSFDKFFGLVNTENMHIYDIINEQSSNKVQVFFDRGNGFSEKDSFCSYFDGSNARLNIAVGNAQRLRIDPTDGNCIVKINSLRGYNGAYYDAEPQTNGMRLSDNMYVFMSDDPNIVFDVKPCTGFFDADIDITPLKNGVGDEIIRLTNSLNSVISRQNGEYMCLEEKYNDIEGKYNALTDKNNSLNADYERLSADAEILKSEIDRKQTEADNYKNMYEAIKNSTFWKMTSPLRKAADMIRGRSGEKNNVIQRGINKIEHQFQRYTLSVDDVYFKDSIFYIKGWLIDKKSSIRDMRLFIRTGTHRYELPCRYGSPRPDVGTALGNTMYNNCGFTSNAKIENCSGFCLCAKYEYDDKYEELEIMNVKSQTPAENGSIIISEVRQNGHTALNTKKWLSENVCGKYAPDSRIYDYTIDIVIPIYNGYEFFEKLFSSIKNTKMKYNLIIVNDKSPDERVKPYLDKYAAENDNTVILENEENLGFVGSANRGISYCTNHIALVNSDVEVPEMWLERLMYPIIFGEKTASSTPFTTCGTICSFPDFCQDNKIFKGLDVNTVDSYFSKIKPHYVQMPTGVGFCMGMNIDAVKEIGILDMETFGRGYGEENDWCQRAEKSGYKNVMVENLFVWHKHGGSFLSEEKMKLVNDHLKKLNEKHPNYAADVERFCLKDPSRDIRNYMICTISSMCGKDETILAFDHNIGGGAAAYLDNFRKNLTENQNMVTVRYDAESGRYYIECHFGAYSFIYDADNTENLKLFLNEIHFDAIYLNEIVTYNDPYYFLSLITELKETNNARLILLYHDFYSVCPGVILLNGSGVHCSVPDDINVCQGCLKCIEAAIPTEKISMEKWRESWKAFMLKCDEVRTFSQNSAEIVKKAFGELDNITVVPHSVDYMFDINKKYKTTDTLNIGFIGAVSKNKGLDIIKQMLDEIESQKMNVNIIVMGYTSEEIKHKNFRQTGKYRPENLPDIVYENDIDIVFISSVWPETFSYTTDEAVKMGLPVAAFRIGAPPERLVKYDKSLIIDEIDGKKALYEIIPFAEKMKNEKSRFFNKKALIIADKSSKRARSLYCQLYSQGLVCEISEDRLSGFDCIISFKDGEDIFYAQSAENIPNAKAYIAADRKTADIIKIKHPNKKVFADSMCADNETISLALRARASIKKYDDYSVGIFSHSESIEITAERLLESGSNIVLRTDCLFSDDFMKRFSKRILKTDYESIYENMAAVNAVISDDEQTIMTAALCGTPFIDKACKEKAYSSIMAVKTENGIADFCINEV